METLRFMLSTLICASLWTAVAAHGAGVVTVHNNGNTLTITGDGAGNRVQIVWNGSQFDVTTPAYDNGTVIRGTTTFSGLKGDLVVNLNGGDDRLTITEGNLTFNNVTINSGTGEVEFVYLARLTIMGNLSITSQATKVTSYPGDASDIRVEYVSVSGTTRINTGSGSDNVTVYPEGYRTPKLQGAVSIDTRDGNDSVYVMTNGSWGSGETCQIGGALTIRTGAGRDYVALWVKAASISLGLGDADDYLLGYGCGTRGGTADVDGGSGTDTFKNQGANSSLFTKALTNFEIRQ